MISKLAIVALAFTAATQARAQSYNACSQAFSDAQALALYGTWGEKSIKSDIDRIQDISNDISSSLRGLDQIARSASRVTEISGAIGTSLYGNMVQNVQETYNNNYNTQRILEGALQKYEQKLNEEGLGDVVGHLRNALNSAGTAERFAKYAEMGANSVKAKVQQLDQQIRSETQNIAGSLRNQTSYLKNSNNRVEWLTERLVGRNYWSSHSVDPYSKLGSLERIMSYMQSNSCIRP